MTGKLLSVELYFGDCQSPALDTECFSPLRIALGNVRVSTLSYAQGADSTVEQQIVLTYQAFEVTTTSNVGGSPQAPLSCGWDFLLNRTWSVGSTV
jgi:hypothetical protein